MTLYFLKRSQSTLESYNHVHNILRPLMVEEIFLSPEVKRIVVISNNNSICDLPHEFPNDLRLRTLGN